MTPRRTLHVVVDVVVDLERSRKVPAGLQEADMNTSASLAEVRGRHVGRAGLDALPAPWSELSAASWVARQASDALRPTAPRSARAPAPVLRTTTSELALGRWVRVALFSK